MKSNRTLIIIGVSIVALIVVLIALNQAGMLKKDKTPKVSCEKVEYRTIIETVSANGKIQPETEVKISPYISGEVVELNVKEGDQVQKGELLARIDPEIYQKTKDRVEASLNSQKANLANSRARLAQSRAKLVQSESDYKRNETLFNQQVISEAEFEGAKASYDVAVAEVEAAEQSVQSAMYNVKSSQASLDEALENLNRTAIYSPTTGTVSRLNVEMGERVTGASQFSSGTEIMVIANLDLMEVNVEVNENDIVRVDLFDTCIIEVDAYLRKEFKGVVTEIATSANTSGVSVDQVTNFDVKIRILQESYEDLISEHSRSPFRPGMSATVDIRTETVSKVLTIPIQAVTTREDTTSGTATSRLEQLRKKQEAKESGVKETEKEDSFIELVFLYENGKAIIKPVKTGVQDSKYIEIKSGLNEEHQVITGPYKAITKNLKNGDPVKKVDKSELFEKD
jgi:HlyD family secretion protein